MEGIQFYRCKLCGHVVSKWDIHEHKGCPRCTHRTIMPTDLGPVEKLVQIIKHPAIWKWHEPLQTNGD